jgi:hypothetical protein
MFKVGDKVVRTKFHRQSPSTGWPDFEVGKVYTVAESPASGSFINIKEMPVSGFSGYYSVDCFRLAKYSEYFTEPTPTPSKGHVADSPIQKHSVGDIYPLAVVCYADGDKQRFVIENLERGEVAVSSLDSDTVLQWNRAANAHRFAELGGKCGWAKGRPVYGPYGGLVMPAKVREAERAVINMLTVNGAYYQALEQDIG